VDTALVVRANFGLTVLSAPYLLREEAPKHWWVLSHTFDQTAAIRTSPRSIEVVQEKVPLFPIGANGIVMSTTAFYVTNTDQASIVKIPIKADGTAGTPADFVATDCANLGGADGLAIDSDGSFIVAANAIQAITRVSAEGKPKILVSKDVLDSPASVSISGVGGAKDLFITNSALTSATTTGEGNPGLLKLPLGG
jgi:sugar lactone lactonase YvrE